MLQDWISAGASGKFFQSVADRGNIWSTRKAEAEPAGIADGMLHGTLIATPTGWRPVESLAPGDLALTFDYGLQAVVEVRRSVLWSVEDATPRAAWPVQVPAGAIGNRTDLLLLPEQAVMIEDDAAEEMFGDPFALVAAAVLDGYRGCQRARPQRRVEVATPVFDREQVLYANGSALLHAPGRAPTITQIASADAVAVDGYPRLPRSAAKDLMARLAGAPLPAAHPMVAPGLSPVSSGQAYLA
jgi:hypothetical protein